MHTKYLVFKSIRGLDRPWLVFTPNQRMRPTEDLWKAQGFATWRDALDFVRQLEENN